MKDQIVELLKEHGVLSTKKLKRKLQKKEDALSDVENRETRYFSLLDVIAGIGALRDEGKLRTYEMGRTRLHELIKGGGHDSR